MRLLLDTNAWLWMTLASERLGPRTYALLADGGNAPFLSVVSAWEIVIKAQLGKLRAQRDRIAGSVRMRCAP
jgi:PIN domain nuclease of toxin-antitoxin system